jgi:hypothetical protein
MVGTEPTFATLCATIHLEFQKGSKQDKNDETEHLLTPLTAPDHLHMCPLMRLMIHRLRHSLIAGPATTAEEIPGTTADGTSQTLQHVLEHAFRHPDHSV